MEFKIRPARHEDAAEAVPLIYSSGPTAFDFVFKSGESEPACEFLNFVFRQESGEFGFGNHTVVTHLEDVVGAGACFGAEHDFAFTLAAVRQMLAFYGLRNGLAALRRGLQIHRLYRLPPRGQSYIAHLGVAPSMQGRGIGRLLIERFLAVSREQSKTHCALDVSMENPRAQALYHRLGFRVTAEQPPLLEGVPGHRRMEISL